MSRTILVAIVLVFTLGACGPSYEDALKHDPEAFRPQIEEIETLLQKPENEPGDGGKLHVMCANLAGALGTTIENHTHKEVVMNGLISFGEAFAHQEEQDLPWDIAEARELWTRIRDRIFLNADWFQ